MRLDTSVIDLQQGVWMGPATTVLADLADAGSALREQSTSGWKNQWTEKSFDFPNSYVDLPMRYLSENPISTYTIDQNTRFSQRYK